MADLQAKCNECDESCDVAPNNLGLRNRRDLTEKKTVFDFGYEEQFLAACGHSFFLGGELPKGFDSIFDVFICQTYKNDPYFATMFSPAIDKIAVFSAYKPNIGNLDRPDWRNLYEHGTYTGYLIYTYFSSHIHSYWAF